MYRYLAFLFMASAIVFCPSCIREGGPGPDPVSVGDRLPDFSVIMSDGSEVNTSSLAGKVSCIVFFHTGCPDCRSILPDIQRLYDIYSGEVEFVCISREEPESLIAPFWDSEGLTMPFSPQEDRTVYSLFASERIPRVYISDRDRTVRYVFSDSPVPGYGELCSALESLSGE